MTILRMWLVRLFLAACAIAALLGVQAVFAWAGDPSVTSLDPQPWLSKILNPYNQRILALAGIAVILAVSLNLINGIAGQFSLGHAGFMAIGAYTGAAFTTYVGYEGPRLADRFQNAALSSGVMLIAAMALAAITAGIAGLLVGLPSLRLRGDYLAIVTLGFGQIIITIIRTINELGAATGFNGLHQLSSFAWVWGMAALCVLTIRNIADSSLGREMRAVREDEIAAKACGINTTRVKVLAFVISAMWAGIAGALQAHLLTYAQPESFQFLESVKIVVMVTLGGLGSITGSAFAAVLLRILEEKLRDPGWAFGTLFGLCFFAALLSLPRYRSAMKEGILGWVSWLLWPTLCAIGIAATWFFSRDWLASSDGAVRIGVLRYLIYALILIVLMLLRPQGLFGRSELGAHLWRKRNLAQARKSTP